MSPVILIGLIVAIAFYKIFTDKSETINNAPAPGHTPTGALQRSDRETTALNDQTPSYDAETEEQFIIRCHRFIAEWLDNVARTPYYVSPDNQVFRLGYEHDDGTVSNYHIHIRYHEGLRFIEFSTRVSQEAIPDHKLADVAELVNRLNGTLLLHPFTLNYERRSVDLEIFYVIGDNAISPYLFDFYFRGMFRDTYRMAFNRVIEHDEAPAIVALDW